MKKAIPILFIALSASLWGIIAIFVRKLTEAGFTPMEIVTIRVVTAAILLGIIGGIKYPAQMKIKIFDIKLFIGTGICSIVLFNWCYFTAINQMNLSLAVILLYTAPAFVTILSYLLLKEKMDQTKILAVIATIVGCVLVAGVNLNAAASIRPIGILTGLGAGFGYALYTIFGKFALRKYSTFTVTLYTFFIASITLLPVTRLWDKWSRLVSGDVLLYGIGLGLFPTVIAYLLYTKGLEKVEGSKASIIATVEPVVATILSVFLYEEGFGFIQAIGSIVILLSVLIINRSKKSNRKIYNKKASI
ncbi:DMT family transporter [Bacillus salipaludis]|uniref:DMT family transporter n=1 Tax=Bacillus salipaludis TaxID=2547811 RepID=A0ABW8RJE0_9BACI